MRSSEWRRGGDFKEIGIDNPHPSGPREMHRKIAYLYLFGTKLPSLWAAYHETHA